LDITAAAEAAGFSLRHFRRIIIEDKIPVVEIGGKKVIDERELEAWKATRGEMRLEAALQQVDGWISKDAARTRLELANLESDF
jgi:hypothetical protein